MTDYFMARLSQMEFKYPATVRIKGLAIGVGLGGIGVGDADYASKVSDKCRRAGLLVTSEAEAPTTFAPLNIDQTDARKGLDILEACL